MTQPDKDYVLEMINGFTPGFGQQLAQSPLLLAKVLATLTTPLACAHLAQAVERWADTHRQPPTWRQLQDLQEEMEHERRKEAALNRPSGSGPVPVGDVLHDTLGRMPPPDREADRAWAQMHIQLVLDGKAGPAHLREQMARYDTLAAAHPSLAGHSRLEIERLLAGRVAVVEI